MMEFCWKFYESIKEVKVLFGLVLSLLVLNGVEPNCYKVLNLKEEQTLYVQNNNYPGYGDENICTWEFYSEIIIKAKCYIDLNGDCNENIFFVNNGKSSYTNCGQDVITFEGFNLIIMFESAFNQGRFICEIKTPCQCGKKKVTRIVGGQETGVNEYPWMCGIVDRTGIFCGASIIHAQYVLTAAHCLHKININEILLIVGEHNVTTGNDTKASRMYKIQECEIHSEYNFTKNDYNDIAVCKIVGKIEYSAEVGPVCLPFKYKDYSFIGDIVTALGWGLTEFGGWPSDVLREVDLEVVNNKYPSNDSNDNNMLYTFSPGKDTCQMDSGGPLLWDNHTNHMKLVGIVSGGMGCASNEPSLNMRVGAFLNWIVSVTPDAQYCVTE